MAFRHGARRLAVGSSTSPDEIGSFDQWRRFRRPHLRSSWRLWLIGPLLIAAALQSADLGGKNLWDDEATTVTIANSDSLGDVYSAYRASERQPPLHYFLLHGWIRLAGSSDWAVRVPSAVFSVACVLLVAWLGSRVAGRRVGLFAAYLLAISPFLLLFGPMARYYSLTLFLVLLSTASLLEALVRPQGSGRTHALWFLYFVSSVAMLLTSYTNTVFFVAQVFIAAFVLGSASQPSAPSLRMPGPYDPADVRVARRRAAISLAAVAGAFAIWVAIDFSRLADFAATDRQYAIGGWKEAALATLYPFYAWAFGETIFPWDPAAIAGLVVLVPVVALGLARLATGPRWRRVPIIALATGLVLMVVAFQFFVRDLPFEALTSRGIGGMPFFVLVVAAGLAALGRAWRVVALVALTAAAAVSNVHYFQGRQFHNPAYALPTKQVLATVLERARSSDLILSDPDLPIYYYYRKRASVPPLFSPNDGNAARNALENPSHDRVWVLSAGRDSTRGWRAKWGATTLDAWIKRHFRLERTWRYVRQDPLYARIKARVQGFPSYRYKLVLRLYAREASTRDRRHVPSRTAAASRGSANPDG